MSKKPDDYQFKGIVYLDNGVKRNVWIENAFELQKQLNDPNCFMIFFTSFDEENREKTIAINKNFISAITIYDATPVIEE